MRFPIVKNLSRVLPYVLQIKKVEYYKWRIYNRSPRLVSRETTGKVARANNPAVIVLEKLLIAFLIPLFFTLIPFSCILQAFLKLFFRDWFT